MHDFHLFLYAIIYHHQMMGENKKFFIFSSLTCHSSKISSFLHLGIFSIPPANNRKNSKMFPERVIRNIDYLIEILRIDSEILKFQKKKLTHQFSGLILGSNILTWEKTLMSTRFSQIIDMYYSNRGISYNSTIKASNRKVIFSEILKKTNLTHQVSIKTFNGKIAHLRNIVHLHFESYLVH